MDSFVCKHFATWTNEKLRLAPFVKKVEFERFLRKQIVPVYTPNSIQMRRVMNDNNREPVHILIHDSLQNIPRCLRPKKSERSEKSALESARIQSIHVKLSRTEQFKRMGDCSVRC